MQLPQEAQGLWATPALGGLGAVGCSWGDNLVPTPWSLGCSELCNPPPPQDEFGFGVSPAGMSLDLEIFLRLGRTVLGKFGGLELRAASPRMAEFPPVPFGHEHVPTCTPGGGHWVLCTCRGLGGGWGPTR